MSDRQRTSAEDRILVGLFALALLTHAFLATRNWTAGFMAGHEFRQAQTAIIAHYIDQQDDFSLLYETPILGKPWVGLLLEVPVYEWSVVGLSRLTGLPHHVAARSISLACFYLALPALYLLLGRMGVTPPRRLLPLALILTCPVYIFYSRAFLMESMELLGCAWFLFGFVRLLDRRRWYWFVLTAVAGTGAALIKSATLAIWLIPAAAYGTWQLGRDLRARTGWAAPVQTVFWGLAGVIVPLGALRWWIMLTDPIKAAHASAWIFTSENLSQGNWGLTNLAARVSPSTWGTLLQRWQEAILPPWVIGAVLAAGLIVLPHGRARVLGLAAVFFLAQLLFPFAYAYQDYYFYACAAFLLAGFGFLLLGLLDTPRLRWAGWVLLAVLPAAQLHTYGHGYFPLQLVQSDGKFSFTEALREFLPKKSVIIVAGADWAAMIPLYSQHKALMIRNGLQHDAAYLDRAFAELADEDVAALVLVHGQQQNTGLIEKVRASFDIDGVPTLSNQIADVYCSVRYVEPMLKGLKERNYYGDLTAGPAHASIDWAKAPFRISHGLAATMFGMVSPAPLRGYFRYGPGQFLLNDGEALNAHPNSDLWLRAPGGAGRIEWEYGIFPGAYEREGAKTDGVEFAIRGLLPGGGSRMIFKRTLDPVNQPADRSRQLEIIPYHPILGEILHFTSRPRESTDFDWTYWARIDVK